MKILGIGTDIIEVSRIREALKRHGDRFSEKLFTEKEIQYCKKYHDPAPHYAGRFAAKEAILKALGTGLDAHTNWKEIEILNNSKGKPEVLLSSRIGRLFPQQSILLSISHCKEYATATALLTYLA